MIGFTLGKWIMSCCASNDDASAVDDDCSVFLSLADGGCPVVNDDLVDDGGGCSVDDGLFR